MADRRAGVEREPFTWVRSRNGLWHVEKEANRLWTGTLCGRGVHASERFVGAVAPAVECVCCLRAITQESQP